MNNDFELNMVVINGSNDVQLDIGECRYACCGNCRYYDGDGWCGYLRCSTTGGDHCSNWDE